MSLRHPTPVSQAILGLFLGTPLAPASVAGSYTVIIPNYNRADTVADVVESVLRQTKKPFEVIVVDDASTDNSLQVLEDYSRDDRITLVRNEANMGKAASINRAVKLVRTPYTLVVDADTILDERFAHEALRGFYKESVQAVSGLVLPRSISRPAQKSRLVEYLIGPQSKKVQVRLGGVWTLAGCAMMWRTGFLREHPIPVDTVVEDMDASWLTQSLKNGEGKHMRLGFNPAAVSYTEDPTTLKQYIGQVHRWYSVRPIIAKRFRQLPRALKGVVAWSFVESLLPFLWLAFAGWLAYSHEFLGLALLLGADLALTSVLAVLLSSKYRRKYSRRTLLKSVPYYYAYRFVNAVVFWRAIARPKRRW